MAIYDLHEEDQLTATRVVCGTMELQLTPTRQVRAKREKKRRFMIGGKIRKKSDAEY
jgi:hypothetical protein